MNREEAVKWLSDVANDYFTSDAEADALNMAIKALEQPEIIRCKDCKHRGEKPIADGRYWCEIHDTFMYYCSDAERRTDESD